MSESGSIDPDRISEIIATSAADGSDWRGSGYLVTPGRVLTAAHVVTGMASIRVRFNARRPDEWEKRAEVAWLSAKADVAVLTIQSGDTKAVDSADTKAVDPVRFGRMADRDEIIDCRTMGFPRFKRLEDTDFRESHLAAGTIALLSNRKSGQLEISLPASSGIPDDGVHSPWEGMSGAAVWSRGRIIGVVGKHYRAEGSGSLTAIRLDTLFDRLEPAELDKFCRLTGMPSQFGELDDVLLPDEAALLLDGFTAQVRDIAPAQLEDRDSELADIVRFCYGDDPYLWWQAPPWAGKSALAAWFVLHPPPGVVIVSFFITRRMPGQADSEAFTSAMLAQLAALAGEVVTPAASFADRDRQRRRLLELAAARVHARGSQLVIVIDGLDEDAGATPGSPFPSIAELLPPRPIEGLRVIVTSRTQDLPDEVPSDHPLRRCVPRLLSPSPYAVGLESKAKGELRGLLTGDQPLQIELIGLIAAAGGGLTVDELAELAEPVMQPRFVLEEALAGPLGRIVSSRGVAAGLGAPVDRVYVFAHDTLAKMAEERFGHTLLGYRERLYAWADSYRKRGWPAESPPYLLRSYGQMLAGQADIGRLMQLTTDYARHDRMLAVSFGDSTALGEISAARNLLTAQPSPDVVSLALLAVSTDRLVSRNRDVPLGLPATWARLGQTARAEAAARGVPELYPRAQALAALAEALTPIDRDAALAAAATAHQTALACNFATIGPALRHVVKALAGLGRFEDAEKIARDNPGGAYEQARCYAALAAARAASDPGEADRLARAARDVIQRDSEHPLDQARLIADLAVDLKAVDAGATRQSVLDAEAATEPMEEPFWQVQALIAIVTAFTAVDAGQAAATAERAEQVAADISDPDKRLQDLAALTTAVARADPEAAARIAERARDIAQAETTTDDFDADKLRSSAVQALAAAGLLDAAWDVLTQTRWTSPFDLDDALAALADSFARSGRWADAERAARGISVSWEQADALLRLSGHLVRAGELDAAEQVAASIGDGARRAEALTGLASALIPLDTDRACRAAAAAERTARQESQPPWHDETLAELAGALTEDQQWEAAERVVLAMPQASYRNRAIASLIGGLAHAGRADDVMRLYRCLGDPAAASKAEAGIVRALCATRHWDEAEELAARITEPYYVTQAFAAIATAIAAEDAEHSRRAAERAAEAAQAVPSMVTLAPDVGDALVLAVGALADARCWDAAEQTARGISGARDQGRALAVLAGALATADEGRARDLAREAAELAAQGIEREGFAGGVEALAFVAEKLTPVDQDWAWSVAKAALDATAALPDYSTSRPSQQTKGLACVAGALLTIFGRPPDKTPDGSVDLRSALVANVLADPDWRLGLRVAARLDPSLSRAVSDAMLAELTAVITPPTDGQPAVEDIPGLLRFVGHHQDRERSASAPAPIPLEALAAHLVDGDLPEVATLDPYLLGCAESDYGHRGSYREHDPYVARGADAALRDALQPGKLVLLVGPSKAGKTRTAFEALASTWPHARLAVPTPAGLSQLADHPRLRETEDPIAVWLGDLYPYLDNTDGATELGPWLLARLAERPGPTVVLTTMQPQERARLDTTPALANLAPVTIELASTLEDSAEQAAAREAYPRENLTGVGLGEQLAHAPALLQAYRDAQAGDAVRYAVVRTAVDWARAGLHRPVPEADLRDLTREVLQAERPGLSVSDGLIDEALDWARTRQPGTGQATLLSIRQLPDDGCGYLPCDYLVAADDGQAGPPRPISEPFWGQVLDRISTASVMAVGLSALLRGAVSGAIAAYRKAAEAGDPTAMANLAWLLQVKLQPPDLVGARRWWERAAEGGHTIAMINLATLLAGADPPDTDGARRWLERAAAVGETHAMTKLAALLEDADPPDLDEATHWYKQGAEAGDVTAMDRLAALLMRQDPPDKEGARRWWLAAAEAGDTDAMIHAGFLLRDQDPPDLDGARHWWRRAAEAGRTEIMLGLGMLLERKDPPDLDGARHWYQRAAEAGDDRAMNNLAILLSRQDPPDVDGAGRWWQRAAEAGNVSAMPSIAWVLQYVRQPPDLDGARHWWEQAAQAGSTDAMVGLAELLASQDPPDLGGARHWWEQAAQAGSADAMVSLGLLHVDQDPPDLDGARDWWQRAADAGDADAMIAVAAIQAAEGDVDSAGVLLLKAVEAGRPAARDYASVLDGDRAVREAACARLKDLQDDTDALNFLGIAALRTGSPDQASVLWTRSADAGDATARVLLTIR